jgi:hypothetical protein
MVARQQVSLGATASGSYSYTLWSQGAAIQQPLRTEPPGSPMQAAATQLEKTPNLDRVLALLADEVSLHRRRGKVADARFLNSVLKEIEDAREEDRNRVLSVAEAAHEGGFSQRQVRRKIGKTIPNANPHGAPGVRYRDVPRKRQRTGAIQPRRPAKGTSGDRGAAGAVTVVVLEGEE